MKGNKVEFYHSKSFLFFGIILSILVIGLGIFFVYFAFVEESNFVIAQSIFAFFVGLFCIVSLGFLLVTNILKMIRGNPYITITEKYIQLDPSTKSEVTIYLEDIEYIRISEGTAQKALEIDVFDESDYFDRLSSHNKKKLNMNRLTGLSLFVINMRAVRKQDRSVLLETLERINQKKAEQQDSIF